MTPTSPGELNTALSDDFLDFILCLDEAGVEVILVGGYALAVHGVVRATGDIDFLYRRTPENVTRLCAAMTAFGAPGNVIDEEALMTPDVVTQFGEAPFRIDLLNAISGVSWAKVRAGSIATELQGQKLRVIGWKELRDNKLASGRKKDLADATALTKLVAGPSASSGGGKPPRKTRRRK